MDLFLQKAKTFLQSIYNNANVYVIQGVVVFGLLGYCLLLLVSILSCPIFGFVILVTKLLPKYGRVCSFVDIVLAEDYSRYIPKSSIVTTLVIDGDIRLDTLRQIFWKNVLEARCPSNKGKLRYPELKQRLASFLGIKVWRNEGNFDIQQHILEEAYTKWTGNGDILEQIHGDFINRTFPQDKSPWEITLMRNVPQTLLDTLQTTANSTKTVLTFRIHHVLADAKSILKMFVECLGGKELKTANPREVPTNFWNEFNFISLFPLRIFLLIGNSFVVSLKNISHPWKVGDHSKKRNDRLSVTFSSSISMNTIKDTAVQFNVTGSAVIMSIISRAIEKTKILPVARETGCAYILPKLNHPETLANHAYVAPVNLPTDEPDPLKRLERCHEEFQKIKLGQHGKYMQVLAFLAGGSLLPLIGLPFNHVLPCGITNIAGESEGFCVNGKECEDFRMSVGTLQGACGVVFCAFSYRNTIRLAIIGGSHQLPGENARRLAEGIGV